MSAWYILRTSTRQEAVAQQSLREAFGDLEGFETYLPCVVRWERRGHQRARTKRLRPMLAGYMFVTVPNGDFKAVESVDGVSCVLRYTTPNGERWPRSVDTMLIHALRMIEASGEFDEKEPGNGKPKLSEGQSIKITGGQFNGLSGILKKLRPNKRAQVLIEMFGRSSPAELPIAQLSAA